MPGEIVFLISVQGNDECGGEHLIKDITSKVKDNFCEELIVGESQIHNLRRENPKLSEAELKQKAFELEESWWSKNKKAHLKLLNEHNQRKNKVNLDYSAIFQNKSYLEQIDTFNNLAEKSGLKLKIIRWGDWLEANINASEVEQKFKEIYSEKRNVLYRLSFINKAYNTRNFNKALGNFSNYTREGYKELCDLYVRQSLNLAEMTVAGSEYERYKNFLSSLDSFYLGLILVNGQGKKLQQGFSFCAPLVDMAEKKLKEMEEMGAVDYKELCEFAADQYYQMFTGHFDEINKGTYETLCKTALELNVNMSSKLYLISEAPLLAAAAANKKEVRYPGPPIPPVLTSVEYLLEGKSSVKYLDNKQDKDNSINNHKKAYKEIEEVLNIIVSQKKITQKQKAELFIHTLTNVLTESERSRKVMPDKKTALNFLRQFKKTLESVKDRLNSRQLKKSSSQNDIVHTFFGSSFIKRKQDEDLICIKAGTSPDIGTNSWLDGRPEVGTAVVDEDLEGNQIPEKIDKKQFVKIAAKIRTAITLTRSNGVLLDESFYNAFVSYIEKSVKILEKEKQGAFIDYLLDTLSTAIVKFEELPDEKLTSNPMPRLQLTYSM